MIGAYQMDEVDVPGLLAIYQNSQDRRTRQIAAQKETERADRKEERERDFDDAYGRFVGSGGLEGAFGGGRTPGRLIEAGAGAQPSSRLRGVADSFSTGAARVGVNMHTAAAAQCHASPYKPYPPRTSSARST